jgi:predicted transcriptional regulator
MTSQSSHSLLVLSIQSVHAERIFKNVKLFELRKLLPKGSFSRVYLYETGGRGIIGCFDPGPIITQPVKQLWETVGESGTRRERFFLYFSKAKVGHAIPVQRAIQFRMPISPATLKTIKPTFTAPMSYLLVQARDPLYLFLENIRKLNTYEPTVTLKRLMAKDKPLFVKWVTTEIAPKYADITEAFAKSILRSHALGRDPNGIFTQKKRALSIYNCKSQLIGFTTLTYKIGGCVKTGPTVLFPKYRGKGFGAAVRRELISVARREYVRKLYCTCPDNDLRVITYLIKSGFSVEAHLKQQYSVTHGELVFGHVVTTSLAFRGFGRQNVVRRKSIGKPLDSRACSTAHLLAFFCQTFQNTWIPISKSLASSIISKARRRPGNYEEKPVQLICYGRGRSCNAMVLLVPKRGGAVKGLWLSATRHRRTLKAMLRMVEHILKKDRKRKLYFVHPVGDVDIISILKSSSYQTEGLLNQPYRGGQDAIVLSKMLNLND